MQISVAYFETFMLSQQCGYAPVNLRFIFETVMIYFVFTVRTLVGPVRVISLTPNVA